MKIISHRGNLNGPIPKWENTTEYINEAVADIGYCEVDVWCIDNVLFLGHDAPTNRVHIEFFLSKGPALYIHCKNFYALRFFTNTNLNYFYHEDDRYTLTSHKEIWAFPHYNGVYGDSTIVAVPEFANIEPTTPLNITYGVCTDYPIKWRDASK
jgi:hypothetical protein